MEKTQTQCNTTLSDTKKIPQEKGQYENILLPPDCIIKLHSMIECIKSDYKKTTLFKSLLYRIKHKNQHINHLEQTVYTSILAQLSACSEEEKKFFTVVLNHKVEEYTHILGALSFAIGALSIMTFPYSVRPMTNDSLSVVIIFFFSILAVYLLFYGRSCRKLLYLKMLLDIITHCGRENPRFQP